MCECECETKPKSQRAQGTVSVEPWPSGAVATLLQANFQPVGDLSDLGLVGWSVNPITKMADAIDYSGQSLDASDPRLVMTHRGVSDVNGARALITVAREQLGNLSLPGAGATNDVWLWDGDTGVWSCLISGADGIIWPRFDPSGTKIVYGQMTSSSLEAPPFGAWTIYVANLVVGDKNVVGAWNETEVVASKGLCEPYGWDGNNILYAAPSSSSWTSTCIWMTQDPLSTSFEQSPVALTEGYSEFAGFDSTGRLLFGWANGTFGLELWRENNMSIPERITYFNPPFGAGIGQWCWQADGNLLIGVTATAGGPINCYEIVMPA